ncbi:Glucokinase [Roseivivax jejudonensis]|uniref:Glucokinase n=1 Tax=Roseivivax jejudonensis TaxID=1529041 RepID=A0A1X6Z196_9RHOB|nr:glucokinase [Roseivivax jejudonensis]SLN37759.1 Glucokinase [Roseivivax jejudonensis]
MPDRPGDSAKDLAVVADIGGTNTRVALARGPVVDAESIARYRNADHGGLTGVLSDYLAQHNAAPVAACVAMAGPVRDGVGRLTNLDWTVDRESVARATGAATVAVLNDLQAQGHAVDHLSAAHLTRILPGRAAAEHAAKLVIGVGTGLNAAPVFRLGGQTLVPPSESGHVSLPAQDADDLALRDWLVATHGSAGAEEALSGRGFERIHAFLCARDGGTPRDAAGIMAAHAAGDAQATRAMEIFATLLGRVAGNLALTLLPFGGIYLCGGVARHFGPHLVPLGFAEGFRDKGRFAGFMDQFGVELVTDDYAALTGSAAHLAELA